MKQIAAATFWMMAKRPFLLMAVLATILAAAVPAFAQQGPTTTTATGVLVGPVDDGDLDPTLEYRLTDEATGTNYVLISGFVELEPFAGQRVTIAGVPIGGADNAPPALNVTQIEPADEDEDPSPSDKATLSFELTVYGDPPAGANFYGNVGAGEGGPGLYVPLTDPDEDRVYTGTTTVDRFGPGPRPVPPGTEPVSLPVEILQEINPEVDGVIKDFGTVKLDEDKTFEASVSFPVDDCPIISPTPEQCGDDSGSDGSPDDGSPDGDSDNNAGSGGSSGGSGSGGSGADSGTSDDGSSGSGDSSGSSGSGGSGSGDSSNGAESGGSSGGVTDGIKDLLPSTGGGMALSVLIAGVLLIGGGLLIRKLAR